MVTIQYDPFELFESKKLKKATKKTDIADFEELTCDLMQSKTAPETYSEEKSQIFDSL